MKKQFYQLAIGFFGLLSVLTIQAQKTPCDSAYIYPGINLSSDFNNEFQRCGNWMQYELLARSNAKSDLYFHWYTKDGKYLTQGTSFKDDTTGQFYVEIEGGGCLKEIPFTIFSASEVTLQSSAIEYCKGATKPEIYMNIVYSQPFPKTGQVYNLYRDNQFVTAFINSTVLTDAEAGTYTINNTQQCPIATPTLTITEKDCAPKLCEPTSDSVYDATLVNQIYQSCAVAGWKLNFPNDKQPTGVEIIWIKNGSVLSRNHTALSVNVTGTKTPDKYSVEVTGQGCSWYKEISIIKDSINTEIISSDANYRHCPEKPIQVSVKGNTHLTGEIYTWEKKDTIGVYQLHGKGDTLPNPTIGMYRMYVKTKQGCVSMATEFSIVEGQCSTAACAEFLKVEKIDYNPLPGKPILFNGKRFFICNQEQLGLEAYFMPVPNKGSITWYNVTTTIEQNVGGNPFYTTVGGKYIARYTDGNCIVNSDTIIVDYAYTQPLEIKVFDGVKELVVKDKTITICPTTSVSLNTSPYYYTYYRWAKNAAFLSVNAEQKTDGAGYYTLITVDNQDCRSEDYLTVNINQSPNCVISGVQNGFNESVQLSPNPVVSSLYIKGVEANTVQVVSQIGQVTTEQVSNGAINLEKYPNGMYTVLIENNGKIEAHRIVKQ